jgi:hypothetical protein
VKKDPNKYPPGWNYQKAKRIARYYDEQNDDEIVAEIEAAYQSPDSVMIQIPRKLLPAVRKLIERQKMTA